MSIIQYNNKTSTLNNKPNIFLTSIFNDVDFLTYTNQRILVR